MTINLKTEDMLHIIELLREDMICSKQILEEEPDNVEAERSMDTSQSVLLKVAAIAVLKGYSIQNVPPNDDPIYIQSRARLN